MEATIGQNIRRALCALSSAKAIIPQEGFDALYDLVNDAYETINDADNALMDLSKAIDPEPRR